MSFNYSYNPEPTLEPAKQVSSDAHTFEFAGFNTGRDHTPSAATDARGVEQPRPGTNPGVAETAPTDAGAARSAGGEVDSETGAEED